MDKIYDFSKKIPDLNRRYSLLPCDQDACVEPFYAGLINTQVTIMNTGEK